MAAKCVHKGCGKTFTDPEEPCKYHPGPPEFHEGQKGWKCCKPRVLTFDEFLDIPPCTTGKHSTIDDTPKPKPVVVEEPAKVVPLPQEAQNPSHLPVTAAPASRVPSPAPEPESEDDDPSLPIPIRTTCRRRGCDIESTDNTATDRTGETCIFHPGHPVFHEGSKGWSCCKKRVLEFDEFMRIQGCVAKDRHKFVGSGARQKTSGKNTGAERQLETVRHDFYQTSTTVHASLFLKKIVKEKAQVRFEAAAVDVDLPTADATRYKALVPLYGPIDPQRSKFKVLGTKLELEMAKADGRGWPVLRADERQTGEIIQAGSAGRA